MRTPSSHASETPDRAAVASPAWVGASEAMRALERALRQAAQGDTTVLILGESGVGKGLVARLLHAWGPRAAHPLVAVDLGASAPSLIESTLFGHERGAFTDAHRERAGCFRQAEGGTLVLEDVDLLPAAVQAKLLRVLQEREVLPLGAERPVPIDVRVVATTNRDLRAEVEAGRFRGDLFYRLAVLPLDVPPLRARAGDLPRLVEHLTARVAERAGVAPRALSPEALERLEAHPWPGNVRELENALERVLVLAPAGGGAVAREELEFLGEAVDGEAESLARRALAAGLTLESFSQALFAVALAENRGNVSAAARQVGLTRRAFEYRIARADGGPGENGENGQDGTRGEDGEGELDA